MDRIASADFAAMSTDKVASELASAEHELGEAYHILGGRTEELLAAREAHHEAAARVAHLHDTVVGLREKHGA